MNGFPGRIFDDNGVSTYGRRSVLTPEQVDACQHRSMVRIAPELRPLCDAPSVIEVWLMDDDAAFVSIPPQVVWRAVMNMKLSGRGILILARLPEIGATITSGLLDALELAQAPDDAAGHA